MKIAVSYENGNVFPHFGRTRFFKIYDIVNGMLVDTHVVPATGTGHGALAGLLASLGVDSVICGGIGDGAQTALAGYGIALYAGCSGSTDQCVTELLAGTLVSSNGACSCHHGGGCCHS